MSLTDARRAEIAAMTPEQLDAAIDAVLRPGVAGTWPVHRWYGRCSRCGTVRTKTGEGPCHVPPTLWASSEPGSEQADVCAMIMLRWLCSRWEIVTTAVNTYMQPRNLYYVGLRHAHGSLDDETAGGATLNISLARVVLFAAEEGA